MKKTIVLLTFMLMIILATSVSAYKVSISDYDPRPAQAGDFVDVVFEIENLITDSEPDEVFLEITPIDGLELSSGEDSEKSAGIVAPFKTDTLEYRVFVKNNAPDGDNIIKYVLTAGDTEVEGEEILKIEEKDILDVDLRIGETNSDPLRIKPDDEDIKLTVTLLNLGDGTAQNVGAEIKSLPNGITLATSYSGTSLVGNVQADDTKDVTFYFDVDKSMKSGDHEAKLELTYKYKPDADEDDYEFETIILPLKISIRPIPLYEITEIKLDPEELTAGDRDVKLLLTVKNVGEEEGESVRVKIFGKTEQPFNFDKSSDFVSPSLKPGEEGQATLEFNIEDGANVQNYFLDLEIRNAVGNDIITYQDKIPISVKNPKRNNPMSLVIIGIIIIVVIVVVIVVNNRNKRKKMAIRKARASSKNQSYLDRVGK